MRRLLLAALIVPVFLAAPAAAGEKANPKPEPAGDGVEAVARLAVQVAKPQPAPAPVPAPPPPSRPLAFKLLLGAVPVVALLALLLLRSRAPSSRRR